MALANLTAGQTVDQTRRSQVEAQINKLKPTVYRQTHLLTGNSALQAGKVSHRQQNATVWDADADLLVEEACPPEPSLTG